jgi:hypothetical protein
MTKPNQNRQPSTCWLHPAVEVGPSPIKGHGLFPVRPLPATVDYATQTTDPTFRVPCHRDTPPGRTVITGTDWQQPEWADRYRGHVVPAIARLISSR